jgi:hypothetical protein
MSIKYTKTWRSQKPEHTATNMVKMKNVLVKNKETFIDSVNQYSILASLIE